MNGEDTSSSSSEEEKEGDAASPENRLTLKPSWSSVPHSKAPPSIDRKEEEDDEEEEGSCLPTIFFSHTVEPKKVRVISNFEHFTDLLFKILHLLPLFFQTLQFNSVLEIFPFNPCLSLASGEDKHRKKHHTEVQ